MSIRRSHKLVVSTHSHIIPSEIPINAPMRANTGELTTAVRTSGEFLKCTCIRTTKKMVPSRNAARISTVSDH